MFGVGTPVVECAVRGGYPVVACAVRRGLSSGGVCCSACVLQGCRVLFVVFAALEARAVWGSLGVPGCRVVWMLMGTKACVQRVRR